MGIVSIASYNSQWRGYEYYEQNMVHQCEKMGEQRYTGRVSGSGQKVYEVMIDVAHPKRSTCTCPFAEGSRKVCKHKVALYFFAFPKEAEVYYKEIVEAEQEEEKRIEELEVHLDRYLASLSKAQLKQHLYEVLYESPQWLFERFIRDHVDDV